ncbi:uncharacterized protein [Nothobranchius furzeri]|uniref:uncharacterized protein n=1 Tax=Nothobranchius furzeri TaxID=105023 RepID=UPI00077D3241
MLLLLPQGYTLIRVTTAGLGEAVTLTCSLPDEQKGSSDLHWYKQSTGNTLTLMVKQLTDGKPNYEAGFSASRLKSTYEENVYSLTILQTVQEDEGMYHCSIVDWNKNYWNGTYLSIKGPSEKGSHTTVIQHTVSDLNRPGDPVTLQCSVFSDSDKKTCSEDLRVFWFRAKSDTSYPDMVYSKGTQHNQCEKKSRNRCVSSMNFSTSDPGTYYCAVATCGQIIFGNGTKVAAETADPTSTQLWVTLTCLVISVIANIAFVCCRNQRAACKRLKRVERTNSRQGQNPSQPNTDVEYGHDLIYSAISFSEEGGRGKKKRKLMPEESVYSQIKL